MTNKNYTAVALVVDRSGSMSSIREESETAINEFIKNQAVAPGKRSIFLAQFDGAYEVVRPTTPAEAVIPYTLEPRGVTALHDAICKTIYDFGKELADLPEDERPAHVLVGIMTDGMENASQEFHADDVKRLIKQQTDQYNWNFLFMAANQDAVTTGQNLGLHANSTITYSASRHGTQSVLNTMNTYTTSVASGLSPNISQADRDDAVEK